MPDTEYVEPVIFSLSDDLTIVFGEPNLLAIEFNELLNPSLHGLDVSCNADNSEKMNRIKELYSGSNDLLFNLKNAESKKTPINIGRYNLRLNKVNEHYKALIRDMVPENIILSMKDRDNAYNRDSDQCHGNFSNIRSHMSGRELDEIVYAVDDEINEAEALLWDSVKKRYPVSIPDELKYALLLYKVFIDLADSEFIYRFDEMDVTRSPYLSPFRKSSESIFNSDKVCDIIVEEYKYHDFCRKTSKTKELVSDAPDDILEESSYLSYGSFENSPFSYIHPAEVGVYPDGCETYEQAIKLYTKTMREYDNILGLGDLSGNDNL